MGYLANFIVYTLAMVGIIMLAVFIFKFSTSTGVKAKSKCLQVVDSLSIGPRKTLYIVSVGNEKFLIAGDVDKTSLISKLETSNNVEKKQTECINFKDTMKNLSEEASYIDRSLVGIKTVQKKPYNSVMKNLAERIKG